MSGTLYFHHCADVMKYDLTYIFKHDTFIFIYSIIFGIKITSDVYGIVSD